MISHSAFLVGNNVYLRQLVPDDIEGPYLTWFNDDQVCRGNIHHVFPYTRDEALAYIAHSVKKDNNALVLAIINKKDDKHLGNIALQSISFVVRSAELSIILGDKSFWGKGIGFESCRLICDHGFNSMNLSRIACGTFESNEGMKTIAQKLGMQVEGCRRNAAFKNGTFENLIEYGILKEEYEKIGSGK